MKLFNQVHFRAALLSACFILACGLISACQPKPVRMPFVPKTIIPDQTPRPDPMNCPAVTTDATQADRGSFVYCQVCMICHGDVGQGLDAYRAELPEPDNNCFQSGCHGAKHPPEGFTIPKFAPVVMGVGVLDHYENALKLHDYLKETMPWWKPGYLTEDEYWQLTTFMLRSNGLDLGSEELNPENASEILIVTK